MDEKPEETVTIPLSEYRSLKRDSEWLGYLESAGVDNWPGYSHAHDLRREARRENRGEPLHG